MATTAINKDGSPRKPPKPYKKKARNKVRVSHVSLDPLLPLGVQLAPIRKKMNISLPVMSGLLGWSEKSGPTNIFHFEKSTGPFGAKEPYGIRSINTAFKYLRAIGVKKVTFIL